MSFQTREDRRIVAVLAIGLVAAFLLTGCNGLTKQQVIDTQIIEKPVLITCKVDIPKECRDRYAVDNLMPGSDPVQENRALRAEIEQRAACEVQLRAAVKGCNQ